MSLRDPAPGLYTLSFEIPRAGGDPQLVSRPVLIAPWKVGLYTIDPKAPGDPEQWARRLAEKPDESLAAASLAFDPFCGDPFGRGRLGENFAVSARATLELPAGQYQFQVKVNDGARLWVDGGLVIEHWPSSDPASEEWPLHSGVATLPAGRHELRLEYFQDTGGAQLWLAAMPLPESDAPTRKTNPPADSPPPTSSSAAPAGH